MNVLEYSTGTSTVLFTKLSWQQEPAGDAELALCQCTVSYNKLLMQTGSHEWASSTPEMSQMPWTGAEPSFPKSSASPKQSARLPVTVPHTALLPTSRSPVSGNPGSSFHFLESGQLLGAMQVADDRSLPPTPRSPSPTCSPPLSPKRQRGQELVRSKSEVGSRGDHVDSVAEDDLEMRAAALGLNEATQRAWRETNLPPTPSSPSPTFSPPSSPKQRRQAELVAEQAAAVLAASLAAAKREEAGALAKSSSDVESEPQWPSVSQLGTIPTPAIGISDSSMGPPREQRAVANASRKKRQL